MPRVLRVIFIASVPAQMRLAEYIFFFVYLDDKFKLSAKSLVHRASSFFDSDIIIFQRRKKVYPQLATHTLSRGKS